MDKILLLPPLTFLILLAVGYLLSLGLSGLAFKGHEAPGKLEQYACGEDIPATHIKPDYSQFFPFAIFFTIMHVVALVVTTIPVEFSSAYALAAVFISSALVGLLILFRR
jgi:NADH:ubiquinone oxidoreductase subunit 3 (subunit A)